MSIVETERKVYESIWQMPAYAEYSPGVEALPYFFEMTGASPGETVLDAGCGSGRAGKALQDAGLHAVLCDVTKAGLEARELFFQQTCLWHSLAPVAYLVRVYCGMEPNPYDGEKFDWAYCCDVMEHIPPQFTMLTVQRLLDVTYRGVFFSIAFVPDQFGVLIGKPLHQTVQPFTWWRDSLSELGRVECRDRISSGLFLVTR